MTITALDLFAGTGWGVACKRLGIDEKGVENMLEAIATREANGMETIFEDVWTGIYNRDVVPPYDLLIASPPCQTFSMAGGGAGRKALDVVLGIITSGNYRYPFALAQFGRDHDPRTALVLTPLYYVWRDRPRFVVLEQVPTVLPVWEAYAAEMRKLGYSVKTAILNAEQYGVPQTRRRAVLVARSDGEEAQLPQPTHSRYYSRDPHKLDDGVLPWVSMAEALGWGLMSRPSPTVTGGGTETGGAEPIAKLARYTSRPDWAFRRPSTTVVGSFSPEIIAAPGGSGTRASDVSRHRQDRPDSVRVNPAEAAVLQSYSGDFAFSGRKGKQFLQIGNAVPPLLAEAVLAAILA